MTISKGRMEPLLQNSTETFVFNHQNVATTLPKISPGASFPNRTDETHSGWSDKVLLH